jgi:hypothetical protein
MKVRELIAGLMSIKDKEAEVYVACDEEWNTIYKEFEIGNEGGKFVIYGLSGSEV